MADVVISELLCFLVQNFKRLDKTTITDIMGKFYHEDELYAAKLELNKLGFMPVDGSTPMLIDGWAKVINKQGAPIICKAGDATQRRVADAEDVIYMFTLLDVNKIVLPKFVAFDLDRVPVVAGSQTMQSNVSKLTDTVEQLVSRMERMEMNIASREAVRISSTAVGDPSTIGSIDSNSSSNLCY